MEYVKLQHDIIKEQNRLLDLAAKTIDELIEEQNELRKALARNIPALIGEDKIKAMLVLNGIKQVSIAKKLKVTPTAICRTLSGESTSKRIRLAIARALNMRVEELWPNNHKKRAA